MSLKFKNLSSAFIVAELSANHNRSLDTAKQTIIAAKRAGADAIKLQTYTPDTITIKSDSPDFIINNNSIWDGKYYYELYKEAYTPWEWHKELYKLADELDLICFSSPFDKTAVDFLESINNPIYKIASFEITDIPLIKYIASKNKPIILSTGIARLDDIKLAIDTCLDAGNNNIAILKCTSSYPAPIDEANLCMISDLREKFNLVTGLSDHTLGYLSPVIAVSFGAKIIEKHFILDKSIDSPDSSFSLTEVEFKKMVNHVRQAEKTIGNVNYDLTTKQLDGRNFSRSLYIVEDVTKGDKISEKNVKSIRPGYGLHPKYLKEILNKQFNANLKKGTRLSLDHIK